MPKSSSRRISAGQLRDGHNADLCWQHMPKSSSRRISAGQPRWCFFEFFVCTLLVYSSDFSVRLPFFRLFRSSFASLFCSSDFSVRISFLFSILLCILQFSRAKRRKHVRIRAVFYVKRPMRKLATCDTKERENNKIRSAIVRSTIDKI